MRQRESYFDNAKVILMFFVVFGHILRTYIDQNETIYALYNTIYTFHMPVFIFCSGYFSRSERSRSGESLLKLLLCYLVFNTGMLLFALIYLKSSVKILTPYYSFWYILSMISWRFLIGKLGNVKGLLILSVLIFVIVYGRMIEIYLMVSLAPIPFATFGNREQSQIGQNYLRSLFALGFQGFLMLICVGIYAVLVQSVSFSEHIIASIWGVMGYTVLLCFSLFKTGSLAKSVFSAH